MVSTPKPHQKDVRSLRNWMNNEKPLVRMERAWALHEEDLIAIRAVRPSSWLESAIETLVGNHFTFLSVSRGLFPNWCELTWRQPILQSNVSLLEWFLMVQSRINSLDRSAEERPTRQCTVFRQRPSRGCGSDTYCFTYKLPHPGTNALVVDSSFNIDDEYSTG